MSKKVVTLGKCFVTVLLALMLALGGAGLFGKPSVNTASADTAYYYAFAGDKILGNIQDKQTAYIYYGYDPNRQSPIKWRILSNNAVIDETQTPQTQGGIMLWLDSKIYLTATAQDDYKKTYNEADKATTLTTSQLKNTFWYLSRMRSFLNGYEQYAHQGGLKNTPENFAETYFGTKELAAMHNTVLNTVGFAGTQNANYLKTKGNPYITDPQVSFGAGKQDGRAVLGTNSSEYAIFETTTDKLFLLDYDDVFNTEYGFDVHPLGAGYSGDEDGFYYGGTLSGMIGGNAVNDFPDYALRNAGRNSSSAHIAKVNTGGKYVTQTDIQEEMAVRPAFNIDHSKVMLAVAPNVGTSVGGWTQYIQTTEQSNPAYKMYLKDTDITDTVTGINYAHGKITLDYPANTSCGKVNVTLCDADGNVHYGTSAPTDASGNTVIVVPYDIISANEGKTFTVKAFLSTDNGGNAVEYAGAETSTNITMVVNVIDLPVTVSPPLEFVYNGTARQATEFISNYNVIKDDVVISGDTATDVGNYVMEITLNTDCKWTTDTRETISVGWQITPKELTVVWSDLSFVYDGQPHAPTATADTGITGITCTIMVSGQQTDAGTYTATAGTANGNFTLTNTMEEFTITPKAIAVTWTNLTFGYDGASHAPTASAATGITGVTCAVTVSGEQTNAGTYTATASTTNTNFTLTNMSTTFAITPKQASSLTVECEASYVYTGSAITPVIVKDGSVTLAIGTDYDVTYTDNTDVGTAGYEITFKGNYSGTASGSFEITEQPYSITNAITVTALIVVLVICLISIFKIVKLYRKW